MRFYRVYRGSEIHFTRQRNTRAALAKLLHNCYSHRRHGKLKRRVSRKYEADARGSGQAKVPNNYAIIRSMKLARNSRICANIIFASCGPHENGSRLPSQKRVAIITVRANNNFPPQFPPSSARVRRYKKKGQKEKKRKMAQKSPKKRRDQKSYRSRASMHSILQRAKKCREHRAEILTIL